MAGPFAAAAVSAAGSLLGGIFGRSKKGPSAGDNAYSHVGGIMEAAEKFGFNPLTLLGSVGAVGGASPPTNTMGAAIADAAMYLGDGMSKAGELKRQRDQLAAERDALQSKVVGLTIRPKVPGIYGTMAMRGPNAGRSGNSRGAAATVGGDVGSSAAGVRPLLAVDQMDARRSVDNKPIPTSSGFVKIDNPHFGFPVYVPSLDGDETLGPDVVTIPLSLAGSYGAMVGRRHAQKRGNAIWDEFNRKKQVTLSGPSSYAMPQDRGYTVTKRKSSSYPW